MNLLPLLLFAFISIPLIELYVLIQVGSVIGALSTIALCILSALTGAALVRVQGFSTLLRVRASLERGELPAATLVEGMLLVVAGLLLITPGFVTDAVGFVLLVPNWRRRIARRFIESRSVHFHPGAGAGRRQPDDRIIEGEFRRLDD